MRIIASVVLVAVIACGGSGCQDRRAAEAAAEAAAAAAQADSMLNALTFSFTAGDYEGLLNASSGLRMEVIQDSVDAMRKIATDSVTALRTRRKQEEVDSVHAAILRLPASDVEGQLNGYRALAALEPENADHRSNVERLEEGRDRQRVRNIIRIRSFTTSRPNSANGVDVRITFTNNSSKTIKYLSWEATPYNAVDDPVSDELGRGSSRGGRATGPVAPGQTWGGTNYWSAVWYNSTIRRAELTRIDIEYMDGSTARISGSDLKHARY